jgi:malate dehydrogenase (oxaloacetate-decarboxylating)(NADP+)
MLVDMPNHPTDGGLQAHGGPMFPRGTALLANPLLNKGSAFSEAEREILNLRGLLPPRVFTLEEQVKRVMGNFRRRTDPLDKYTFLTALQNRNETLFYKIIEEHLEEMAPIIYTPTVGQACLEYGNIFSQPRGLFVSIRDRGRIADVLSHWPHTDVRMIVVTDGERILGLGDLGALGMGIPVGKLSLYTACAGVHPYYCLPITLDVGTDNLALHDDEFYIGIKQKRARGAEYDAFIEEFVTAVQTHYPKALLQWEDFGNTNAFRLLGTYQSRLPSFNDDIQGTAAVALAGLLASLRITGQRLRDQKLLFLGAGEASTGIATLFVTAACAEGLTEAEARARCWFVDSSGLLVRNRPGKLPHHKAPFAHDHPFLATLGEALEVVRPTALIGASGVPRTFTREIVARMADFNERPVIFALSNPTSRAECTAEDAYGWTNGRAIFASGSPFPPVTIGDKTFVPGQGNNVYIFPGVGLGVLACEARAVTDQMFLTAAHTLASLVSPDDLALGRLYPAFAKIRTVSVAIATAVAEDIYRSNLAGRTRPADLADDIRSRMFVPKYSDYV